MKLLNKFFGWFGYKIVKVQDYSSYGIYKIPEGCTHLDVVMKNGGGGGGK